MWVRRGGDGSLVCLSDELVWVVYVSSGMAYLHNGVRGEKVCLHPGPSSFSLPLYCSLWPCGGGASPYSRAPTSTTTTSRVNGFLEETVLILLIYFILILSFLASLKISLSRS